MTYYTFCANISIISLCLLNWGLSLPSPLISLEGTKLDNFGLFVLCLIGAIVILAVIVAFLSKRGDRFAYMIATLVVGGIIGVLVGIAAYVGQFADERWITCHVTEKDRGGQNGSYRVYTDDCGVLSNADAWARGKFNSADVWQQIPSEGTMEFHVVGLRIPILSTFPNILEARPVSE